MSSTRVFKQVGGIGAVVSGILFFLAHLLNLFGNSEYGTVPGASLVFAAHLAVVFAFIGLYEVQAGPKGGAGLIGMLLGIIGTVIVCAIAFAEIAGASGVDVKPVLNSSVPAFIGFGSLLFVAGMILSGVSAMQSAVLPRWGGVLLIAGTLVFASGSFTTGYAETVISAAGGAVTGAGFIWLGLSLLRPRSGAASTNRTLAR